MAACGSDQKDEEAPTLKDGQRASDLEAEQIEAVRAKLKEEQLSKEGDGEDSSHAEDDDTHMRPPRHDHIEKNRSSRPHSLEITEGQIRKIKGDLEKERKEEGILVIEGEHEDDHAHPPRTDILKARLKKHIDTVAAGVEKDKRAKMTDEEKAIYDLKAALANAQPSDGEDSHVIESNYESMRKRRMDESEKAEEERKRKKKEEKRRKAEAIRKRKEAKRNRHHRRVSSFMGIAN